MQNHAVFYSENGEERSVTAIDEAGARELVIALLRRSCEWVTVVNVELGPDASATLLLDSRTGLDFLGLLPLRPALPRGRTSSLAN